MEINFVQQTLDKPDCILACMAMVLNKTLEEVTEDYFKLFPQEQENFQGVSTTNMKIFLELNNVRCIQYVENIIAYGRVYILTVPSLNLLGRNHCIVVGSLPDAISDKDIIVFDPAEGLPDKKAYTDFVLHVDSWTDVVEVLDKR